MVIKKLIKNISIIMIIVPMILIVFGCSSEDKNPTDPELQSFVISDECENPISISFNIEEASLIPIPKEDLTFENLGLDGAETITEELMSEDGFCSLDISPSFLAIFTQVENLLNEGKNTEARSLLSTLLDGNTSKYDQVNNIKLTSSFLADVRQKVRDLLRAAAYDMKAGGDGLAYMDDARSTYSTWAEGQLTEATIQEALRIAAEAQLLGIEGLDEDAIDKAKELALKELNDTIESFDPCLKSVNDVDDLLKKYAVVLLLGAGDNSNHNTIMELAAQSMINNGANSEAVRQVYGDWIEDAVCDGFAFEWTRTVSDGLTFTGQGSSCDGINWEGTVLLSGVNGSGASINSSGSYSFTIPDGSNLSQTTVLTSGTMLVDEELLNFTDPLPMIFTFMENIMQAEILIVSDGSGLLTTPIGPINFASVFTTEPTFIVILGRNSNCNE